MSSYSLSIASKFSRSMLNSQFLALNSQFAACSWDYQFSMLISHFPSLVLAANLLWKVLAASTLEAQMGENEGANSWRPMFRDCLWEHELAYGAQLVVVRRLGQAKCRRALCTSAHREPHSEAPPRASAQCTKRAQKQTAKFRAARLLILGPPRARAPSTDEGPSISAQDAPKQKTRSRPKANTLSPPAKIATLPHCHTAALLHCCTAALLHCCTAALLTPRRQTVLGAQWARQCSSGEEHAPRAALHTSSCPANLFNTS